MEEPNLAVYVELEAGSLIEDVPIRMIATFKDGSTKLMFGRLLENTSCYCKIQAVNGTGDSLLCEATKK